MQQLFTEFLVISFIGLVSLTVSPLLCLLLMGLVLINNWIQLFWMLRAFKYKTDFKAPWCVGVWQVVWQKLHWQQTKQLQMEQRLNQLEQVRQDFVANISHELRTPLTVLKGYLETLAEPQVEHVELTPAIYEQMCAQTDRMARLIQELLLLASLETPQLTAQHCELVDLKPLLERIKADLTPLAAEKNQSLTLIVPDGFILEGREAELHSAFANLVTNAIYYTPENGQIEILGSQKQGQLVVVVKDDGIGIAPEHVSRLTERFYRVKQSHDHHRQGTGLGLAIVKHVLIRHRGQLHIESVPGQGSSFQCIFDLSEVED